MSGKKLKNREKMNWKNNFIKRTRGSGKYVCLFSFCLFSKYTLHTTILIVVIKKER